MQVTLFVAICVIVGAIGLLFVQRTTEQLLEDEAKIEAESWAAYLSSHIPSLPAIAGGRVPPAETIAFLEQASRLGRAYSFRVYNLDGRLMMSSDNFSRGLSRSQPIETIDGELAAAIRLGKSQTVMHRGQANGEPAYYATTLLPIYNERGTAGWLVTNLDQSKRQALFFAMITKMSAMLGGLLVLAPLIGFWYRNRQKQAVEEQIRSLAQRDPVTGLENRASFVKRLDTLMSTGQQPRALTIFELTDLPATAHNFGSAAAEQCLIAAAEGLSENLPDGAFAARLDANHFGLFQTVHVDPVAVLNGTKDICARMSRPVTVDGKNVTAAVAAGIALAPTDGNDAASLMRNAELALHSAVEQGGPGYGFFNPSIADEARRRLDVHRAVIDAAAAMSFRLDYQPVYNIRTGELSGFEALIRLRDPELGNISPAEFIPVAEQTGLINRIGAWCLQEACRTAAQWPPHLMVAVNLSPAQFYSGTLIADVQKALDGAHFPSYRLEVEITEGTMLRNSDVVLEQLRILRERGLAIALDDFGTGYSSLSYLWKFPFSKLKIDRSFVKALDEAQSARGILRSIIKLGHGLGLTVTAEGIETTKQLSVLRELGCDLAQGYLLDRPAPVEDLAAIILRNFAKGLSRRGRDGAEEAPAAAKAGTGSSA